MGLVRRVVSELFLTFHSGTSTDPFVRSLAIPAATAFVGQLAAAGVFVVAGGWALWRLTRRIGLERMTAPVTLSTSQMLWFVLPAALKLGYGLDTPHRRYSSGIVAILHATQHLWITGYYARCEATSAGVPWRPASYFATLVVGGIALFIPGPWVVSYFFAYDFTTTFVVSTAIVNIHHFILDGAIWKLRDGRIAALLVETGGRATADTSDVGAVVGRTARWVGRHAVSARLLRSAGVAALLLSGVVDVVRYASGLSATTRGLQAAVRLNPYNSAAQLRLGTLQSRDGETDAAETALLTAMGLNPTQAPAQHALGRFYIEQERFDDAFIHYDRMVIGLPSDVDAHVNHGLLARQMDLPEVALRSWRQPLALEPTRAAVHIVVAELLDARGDAEGARGHYETFLGLAAARELNVDPRSVVSATLRLVAITHQRRDIGVAVDLYETAMTMGAQTGLVDLESLALSQLAALHLEQDRRGRGLSARDRAGSGAAGYRVGGVQLDELRSTARAGHA